MKLKWNPESGICPAGFVLGSCIGDKCKLWAKCNLMLEPSDPKYGFDIVFEI